MYTHYHLKGFSCLGSSFFLFKNTHIPLCLSRDKTKRQYGIIYTSHSIIKSIEI